MSPQNAAFGPPGLGATWTSSAKDLVTTSIAGTSRVWLTLGHGVGNEIYWPSTGQPQVRDVGFIVTAGDQWFEVKRTAEYTIDLPEPGVLAPMIIHHGDDWTLELRWSVDPSRDVVLISYALTGAADGLYLLVAPHLGVGAHTNSAWVAGDLFAVADGAEAALCVSCDVGFEKASAGYVGSSDGWQDLHQNGTMAWEFSNADQGNVALTAALSSRGNIALGFASTWEGAAMLARATLADGAEIVAQRFIAEWTSFVQDLDLDAVEPKWRELAAHSAAVLACHEDRTYPGATVASLSIPWGNDKGDLGGYHLVWARDAVEVALGRLAIGDVAAARRSLSWLVAAQQPDGHWFQNAYPDGRSFWTGVQLDEVALPVLLAAALHSAGLAQSAEPQVTAMVRRAAKFIVDHGPTSAQDRWEENPGTNAFTLAAVVAALLAAPSFVVSTEDASYLISLARYWNERIEDWLYVENGPLCEGRPIGGYYVRMGDSDQVLDACGRVDVRNRVGVQLNGDQLIACDFLALVRFGIRSANDPRIVDTVALIDELLRVDLPTGVAYHRYNGDGYGEHEDGSPFDGTGIGRPWPLLSGERGHYAAQSGASADLYLDSMSAMAGPGQLLPEQVWDAPAIPERFLEPGRPTGSAMPLAWAHAELIKLATFAARGRPIEQLPIVIETLAGATEPLAWHWRADVPFEHLPAGRTLLIDHVEPFVLTTDSVELSSEPIGMGRHGVPIADPQVARSFTLQVEGRQVTVGSVTMTAAASVTTY